MQRLFIITFVLTLLAACGHTTQTISPFELARIERVCEPAKTEIKGVPEWYDYCVWQKKQELKKKRPFSKERCAEYWWRKSVP